MKKIKEDQSGFAMMAVLLLFSVAFLGIFSLTQLTGSNLEREALTVKTSQAFYLAEAAGEAAKAALVSDFSADPVENEGVAFALGSGEYSYSVSAPDVSNRRIITATGAVPSFAAVEVDYVINIGLEGSTVALGINFDKAILAENDININGKPHTITGDIESGGTVDCSTSCSGVTGTITENNNDDYEIPLPDIAALKALSIAQGNYYSADDIAPNGSLPGVPTDYYYTEPAGGDPGVPNVVFVEGDVSIGGNDTVGGFFVVVGDYLSDNDSDPDDADFTLGGGAYVDGVIYTMGEFVKNGGGNSLNVNGAVMAGDDVELNGNLEVSHNSTYTDMLYELSLPAAGAYTNVTWNDKGLSTY